MSQPVRQETDAWRKTYRSDILAGRRRDTHFKKLERLGVFDLPKDSRILDVCCGEGEMLEMLAEQGFSRLNGLDLPSECAGRKTNRWHYVPGSATQLPFQNESLDYILCAHSLHHLWPVKNIEAFLKESCRCLKKGGRLALIDHYDSPQMRLALSLILSPLALLTPWTRLFRRQHLEERENLYGYLNDWSRIRGMMTALPLRPVRDNRGLFFFYWIAEKPS